MDIQKSFQNIRTTVEDIRTRALPIGHVVRVSRTLAAAPADMKAILHHLDVIENHMDSIRADERRRIREALLSSEWLTMLHGALQEGMYWDDSVLPIPDPDEYAHECLPYSVLEDEMRALVAAIGLTEEKPLS